MASTWREVRARAAETGLIDEKLVDASRTRLRDENRAFRLAEVRRAQDLTQGEIAVVMGVTQPRVSRLERGDFEHIEIATLRSYVEALGGKLAVVAEFADEHLRVG